MDMISEINEEAIKHDCYCLSAEYVNASTNLVFNCKRGHIWERSWSDTKRGRWCTICLTETKLIAKINEIVEEKGGIALLDHHVIMTSRQFFMCKKSHIWKTPVSCIVRDKRWCPHCAGNAKLTINVAHEIAKEKGGFCLSDTYEGCLKHLVWKCAFEHVWTASLDNVKNKNTWCPECKTNHGELITRGIFNILFNENFEKRRPTWLNGLELDGYCEKLNLAFEYDGIQHFQFIEYFHKTQENFEKCLMRDKLKNILCKKRGVILIRIPFWIKYEDIKSYIVEKCQKLKIEIPNNVDIDYKRLLNVNKTNNDELNRIKKIVEEKGGTVLSNVYVNNLTKLTIKCGKDHIFEMSPLSLKLDYWCLACKKKKKHTIEEMNELAAKHKGKCLSKKYINNRTHLKWKCKKKHVFSMIPRLVMKNHWCPKCRSKTIKYHNLAEMKTLAKKKGGKCLSKKYISLKKKLKWKCKNEHIFEMVPQYILEGSWCKFCD